MVCLCRQFEKWLEAEPEDLENDHPTEEELEAFEEAETAHRDMVSVNALLRGTGGSSR